MKNRIAYSLTVNFVDLNWDAHSEVLYFSSKKKAEAFAEKLNANTQFKKDVISWAADLFVGKSSNDVYDQMLPGTIALSRSMLSGFATTYTLDKLPEEDKRDENGKRLTFHAVHGSRWNTHSRIGGHGIFVEEPVKFDESHSSDGLYNYTKGTQNANLVPISGMYKEYYEGKITMPYPELNKKYNSVKSIVINKIELL